jgi:hypothetical protein
LAAFSRFVTFGAGGVVPARVSGWIPLVEPVDWTMCALPPSFLLEAETTIATIPATTARPTIPASP